ncbi:MAG: hypothetical protein HKN36_00470 [Hellea sp.]|nr:hypothetical protein [Hellea sp.]
MTGQIMGAHERAILLDESDGLYQWFGEFQLGKPQGFEKLIAKANTKYRSKHSRLENDGHKTLKKGVDCLVLKAPNLTFGFEALATLDYDVRIIYPIRDPRAVVASMNKLGHIDILAKQIASMERHAGIHAEFSDELKIFGNPETPEHIWQAHIWRIKSSIFPCFTKVGLKPFVFRYESLIENKREIVRAMTKHCGLPFDGKMVRHEFIYQGEGPGKINRSRSVDDASVDKWKTQLSRQQQLEIMEIAGDLARDFAYNFEYQN